MSSKDAKLPDWIRSDEYHNSFLIRTDEGLAHARQHSTKQGLPDIAVSAAQGKLLKLLAQSISAKSILEVGTLGGYSTIWLAQALPDDGRLVTLELSQRNAEVAQANINHAGLASKVELIVGNAAETIINLHPEQLFDLAFIDADKQNNKLYFTEAKRLVRKGGVIIVDNVVRGGQVADPAVNEERVEGVRSLLRELKNDSEVDATTIGTVGEKGYDGFLYAVKL
ncbi:O-methyltransferase [Hygrophoropsis aurantiaca]|uniref:O-methyltransferase n=1 Tax=Hygrophoropsis aurantiaca TaxID=72124 RepID=A0ACB8AF27_9AGAM|nr:O-methyltransferase [Hygrophoropsis aurantiaca]